MSKRQAGDLEANGAKVAKTEAVSNGLQQVSELLMLLMQQGVSSLS